MRHMSDILINVVRKLISPFDLNQTLILQEKRVKGFASLWELIKRLLQILQLYLPI